MFSFFSKKNYLIDYLEGFVDIHNHILPGIDDGAKTVEESIALIRGFGKFGVTDFICTPHIMHSYYPNTPETIKNSHSKLQTELKNQSLGDVSVSFAAEHMIDSNFENLLEENKVMPLTNNYLLVEMSYLQASINFDEAIQKIAEHRYFPILAHPERYLYLHGNLKKHREYKEQGLHYQLNLLSLSKYYGREVQQMALKLLEEGLIDFVGSDIHNSNQLNSLKEIQLSEKVVNTLQPIIQRTNMSF
ncbi:tyrosine-protein phosphatase [Maribacter sp. 2304DJ31-5]|uniref:tyrosine-protein phosphatase n=1 Tax=Maribacter sp. 2304DJ31-5 TaxID=3386273 RepID=UPI0039BD3F46